MCRMDKSEVVIEGAEQKQMEGDSGKGLSASISCSASTETAGGHLGVPRLAGQLMGN